MAPREHVHTNYAKYPLYNCSNESANILKNESQIVTGQTHLTPVQHGDSVFFLETD